MYGHLNNALYYTFFELAIMHYLDQEIDLKAEAVRCYSVENGCRYFSAISHPADVEVGLRVAHLGNSSVRYELALFLENDHQPAAAGFAAEVFVDADTERPTRIPATIRTALQALQLQGEA